MNKYSFNKKIKQGAGIVSAAAVLALPLTAHFEGLRLRAYLDPVGIPTICYGQTEGVKIGQIKNKAECDEMLSSGLGFFSAQIYALSKYEIPVESHAAFTSFAYNVGLGAFARSTLLKKLNAGDLVGGCNELTKWVYAGGKKFTGLVLRREKERALCLEGAKKFKINT